MFVRTPEKCVALHLSCRRRPELCLLSRRCPRRWHRHRSSLDDGPERRGVSHRLLVQPRALLLDVQRDDFPGEGPVPAVADLGRTHNRNSQGGTALQQSGRGVQMLCWDSRASSAQSSELNGNLSVVIVTQAKVYVLTNLTARQTPR